jgi:hypothetical protein
MSVKIEVSGQLVFSETGGATVVKAQSKAGRMGYAAAIFEGTKAKKICRHCHWDYAQAEKCAERLGKKSKGKK